MGYKETQHGRLHSILLVVAVAMLVGALAGRNDEFPVAGLLLGLASLFVLLSLMFATLTVQDEGEWLALRYGPLPVFSKRSATRT